MTATATSVIQQRNSDMVELLKPDFVTRSELTYLTAVDQYMRLPCLRYLGIGGLGSGGEWRDLSGNGMDLAYNGNPVMNYTTQGAPYFYYDGTGDYHSHADDAHFDITGTETTVAAAIRGMTCGAWVYFGNAARANEWVISKYLTTGNQRSYALRRAAAGTLQFQISTDGVNVVTAATATTGAASTWYFIAGRFIPSASLYVWQNDTTGTNVAGIPASIFSGTSTFEISGIQVGGLFEPVTGRIGFPFVCACALSDALIDRLYQASRGLFGV